MRRMLIGLVSLLCLFSAQTSRAKVFMFDMGSADSELRQGFQRVTAKSIYSKEQGYGWKSVEGLKEQHRHYDREWKMNESRGRTQPPPIYTNEVTCDCVFSNRPNTLLVDLAPGRYTVYLLCGRSSGSSRDYHDFDVTAGKAKSTVKIPGPYRFEKRILDVRVEGKQLAIDFRPTTDWLLAGAIIFPAAEEQAVRKSVLDALEREIYFLPPDVAEQWTETKHVDDRPLPTFGDAARKRGYASFARHYSEVIYPNTVPRQCELDPKPQLFASLGEREPVTVTVRALRDLAGVKVTAGSLRMDGSEIAAELIDVRHVRFMLVRPNYSRFFSYHIAPDVLERVDSVAIKQDSNERFWITIRVPDDAKPGVYQGKLTISAAGAPSTDVPLALRVLPIRLRKNPEHIYGMYYRDPLRAVHEKNTPQANEHFRRKAEWERLDMVAHGMNSHISDVTGLARDEQGNWTVDGTETETRIALDRKHGLAGKPLVVHIPVSWWYYKLVDKRGLGSHMRLVRPDVPQSFFDEVTKMVKAVELEKKKYDWPEFLYYPIDEPSTQAASVQFMVNVLAAIKKVPGVRTYVTADPSHEQFEPMWPHVDVWCCQPFVFGHEKIKRLSKEKNIEFWCYPNHISGENDHTPIRGARMTWGYGFWKSGFKTLIPWIYQSEIGDPWNYLDGTAMDFFNRSTPDGRPIPVAMWEAYREGIDDGRYIYTLQQLVEEGKKRGGPAAAAALAGEKELTFLWDSIEVQEKYKYDDLWAGRDFDARRWLLATQILRLQETLK